MTDRFVVFAALISAALLTGCAGAPPQQESTAATGAEAATECKQQYRTGSHIPTRRCQTKEQADAEKAGAEEDLRRSRSGANVRSTGK